MTMPDERTRAIVLTEQFLYDLLDVSKTPKVPKRVREHARALLRHYPNKSDITAVAIGWRCLAEGKPIFRECPFDVPESFRSESL